MGTVLLLLALLGHARIWVALVNRIHATDISRIRMKAASWLALAAVVLLPVGYVVEFFRLGVNPLALMNWFAIDRSAFAYAAVCWGVGATTLLEWLWVRLTDRPTTIVRSHRRRLVFLNSSEPGAAVSEEHSHHFLACLPGNEILQIDRAERVLNMGRLDARLDGLSVVHMSDLHFTGRVGKAYFREVVAVSNEMRPDLVALTGDLVDSDKCLDWIPDVLGPLEAKHGVYFVLGNHDRRVDESRLRRTLSETGLIDLGGRWVRREINGAAVVLAGNELPWFRPAADMSQAPPREPDGGPLRILLAHSPDQLEWAVDRDFDLMLAGHLHGGQIRPPLIGPILSPSRRGVRFASGVFHDPPTILHVSRGVSGEVPVRYNCPPEVTRLVLHACGPPSQSQ
ncbi:MAG: metallophosphoesterase [Pirellulaceae bacterium]|nr:metallophosphoesterase [Pirellulaceae bacterium]